MAELGMIISHICSLNICINKKKDLDCVLQN